MIFTHDAQEALTWSADLVNTVPEARPGGPGPDGLTTLEQLATLFAQPTWTGRFDRDAAELEAVRAIRPLLRRYWTGSEEQAVSEVNATLAEMGAVPQLVEHDGLRWHIHAAPLQAPLADRLRVELAIGMIDVIRADELSRLRTCEGQGCQAVLVDLSRNRSRRFCDGGCAARAHTAAYRARQPGDS